MSLIVLLDSGPLGLVTNPKESVEAAECRAWLRDLRRDGHRVLVPEITDYELRRELLRGDKVNGLRNLDVLKAAAGYLPLTTSAMLRAAQFWATARRTGLPTAADLSLDADVILAAQAQTLDPAQWNAPDSAVLVATTNVGHLVRFTDARLWHDITL